MRKIIRRIGAIASALLLLVIAIPAANSAPDTAADVTAPELVSAELVSDATVGVGDQVIVEWTIRDESELFSVDFVFSGPHGKSVRPEWNSISGAELVRDGDLWHGRSVVTVEADTDPTGQYSFDYASLIDQPWNPITVSGLTLDGFTVEDTAADVTAPELVSAELVSDATVGVGNQVIVEWTIRDESELFSVDFVFSGPHGKSVRPEWNSISGAELVRDGDLWHGRSVVTVEADTDPTGQYSFDYASLIDQPWNPVTVSGLTLDGFTVEDTAADVTAPELVSAELVSDATVGVGDQVIVEWTIRDESELFSVDFVFSGPHGKSVRPEWNSISGAELVRDGDLWHGRSVVTVEADTDPTGQYSFDYASLIDQPWNPVTVSGLTLDGFYVDNPPLTEPTDPVETPEPTDPVETPEPTDPVETPEPTDPVETPEPTDPVETPEPTDPVETPEPTDPVETPEPTDPVETPEPTDPVETPEPTDPVETPEPTDPVETPEPTDPVETPEPTDPVETPEPTDPGETPEPTDPVETPEPTDPVETPEPTDPVETPEPTDPVETPEPTDPVETPEPTDPVETPEPTDPVETPEPTDPVETPEPTDPVETPEPTDPVETPEPTDPVETPEPTDPEDTELVSNTEEVTEEELSSLSADSEETESKTGALAQTGASGTMLIGLVALSLLGLGFGLYLRSRRA